MTQAFWLGDTPLGKDVRCPRDGRPGCALVDLLPPQHRQMQDHFMSLQVAVSICLLCLLTCQRLLLHERRTPGVCRWCWGWGVLHVVSLNRSWSWKYSLGQVQSALRMWRSAAPGIEDNVLAGTCRSVYTWRTARFGLRPETLLPPVPSP